MVKVVKTTVSKVDYIKKVYKNVEKVWGLVNGSQCVILGYSSDMSRLVLEVQEVERGKEWKAVLAARTGRPYTNIVTTRKLLLQRDPDKCHFRGNINVFKYLEG